MKSQRKVGSLVYTNGQEYLVAEKAIHPFYDKVCRGYDQHKGLRPTQEA